MTDKVVPYPKIRRLMAVSCRAAQRKPMIYGLLEVDVTKARQYIREHKAKTGESLSFTVFIIACLAKAVEENKAVQATRQGRKHLIVFEDVDVATQIERDMSGQKQNIHLHLQSRQSQDLPRDSSGDQGCAGGGVQNRHEGFQSHPRVAVLADLSLQAFLLVGSWIARVSTDARSNTVGRWATRPWACLGWCRLGHPDRPRQHS